MSDPRTKAGADLFRAVTYPYPIPPTAPRDAIRAIEDEMLDKVAAAVEGLDSCPVESSSDDDWPDPHLHRAAVLAAIERTRRDDDDR